MEVFSTIMEFLIPNGHLPSAALLKEYSESKVTIVLNTLPPLEYLNSKFGEYNQMSEEDYERLRKIFESRPPIVFYFNPNIELSEVFYDKRILMIGFFVEYSVSVNNEID